MHEGVAISVITCFFNEEKFLCDAVESVLHQKYDNWELILVDDGSTDNSQSIALGFAKRFPEKISCLTHGNLANKGLSASRNLGISRAKSQWIALLDADDIWLPLKLSQQVEIIQDNPEVGMICEASEYYNWNNPRKLINVVLTVGNDLQGLYYPPQLLSLLYPLGEGAAPVPSGIIFKKEAWKNVRGFEESFTQELQMYEDQAFLCKVYLKEIVYISKKCNNRYRQREGSLVQKVRMNGNYNSVRKYFLSWFSDYVTKERLRTPVVSKIIYCAKQDNRVSFYRHLPRTLISKLIQGFKSKVR